MSSYDLDSDAIVQNLMEASAQAGVHNSGLMVSLAGDSAQDSMYFWAGVVRARLDGVKPPVQKGDKVRPKKPEMRPTYAGPDERYPHQRLVKGEFTVNEIRYTNKSWVISVQEKSEAVSYSLDDGDRVYVLAGQCRFRFEDWELVPKKEGESAV